MKKIYILTAALMTTSLLWAQQPTQMILKTTNGDVVRTDISEVEKITFGEADYEVNASGDRIIDASELTWPDNHIMPLLLPPASSVKTLDMKAANLSDPERIMFCSLQGLINRTRPRIVLYNHNEEAQTIWPTAHNLHTSPVLSSTPYALVTQFKDEVKGLVLYSTQRSEHYANLAMTIAGIKNLIPVTAEVQAKLVTNGMDFPVVEDITSLTMTSATDIYNYLYNNYWALCNHRLLISERPLIPYVHDIGVCAGSAAVYLDPRNTSERQVLDKFLQDLTPGRDIVLGWYAEERSGIGEATKYGLSTVPGDFFENASIYTSVKKDVKISPVPKRPKLENKVYATVYLSDGDNIQYVQHAMAKIFEQSGRGKMPMNWTISPALADISPSMLNYYYRKATNNDCFVSGPSGLGYAMPYDELNRKYYASQRDKELITPYVQLTNRYIEKSGLRVITVWDDLSIPQRNVYAENCPYLYGLTVNDVDGTRSAKEYGGWLCIAPQYPWYEPSAEGVANHFNRDIKNFNGTEPMFVSGQVTVWDVGPDKLITLESKLNALSPGNVNIVRADHWFSYYNEAHHLPFNLTLLEDMEITSSPVRTKVQYAADGSPSQGYIWTSKDTGNTGWVTLDFKEPYEISRYIIRHAEDGGYDPQLNNRDFTVEVSLDGDSWTTVGSYTDNTAPVTEATIEPVQARFVRVNVTNGGSADICRIADIEIYGKH